MSAIAASPAVAQARNPFGVGISEGGGSPTGVTGWLLAQQGWFEHQLSAGVRAVAQDPSAGWWLAGIGLIYGVFHAAGPGHGKAVLASYMVANERRFGAASSYPRWPPSFRARWPSPSSAPSRRCCMPRPSG